MKGIEGEQHITAGTPMQEEVSLVSSSHLPIAIPMDDETAEVAEIRARISNRRGGINRHKFAGELRQALQAIHDSIGE